MHMPHHLRSELLKNWYDMIWMEKIIGEHSANPKPVIPISELNELQF